MKRKPKSIENFKKRYGRMFVLHWEIGLVVFFIIPVLTSLVYSFSTVSIGSGGVSTEFVGFRYFYYILFKDASYVNNLRDSVTEMLYSVPIVVSLSLILGVILNQNFKGRLMARAIFFLPVIIATGIVMTLLKSDMIKVPLFTAVSEWSSEPGMINFPEILSQLNLPESINLIFTKFFANVFNLIWSCGIQIVLFIAGLQTIPPSLYEVSLVEGANSWEKFWYITFPMLGRVTLLTIIYTLIEYFIAVDNPVMNQVYAVKNQQVYDRSAAMLWFYFIVIGVILTAFFWIFNRYLKKWERGGDN